jgi:hypothetical protein
LIDTAGVHLPAGLTDYRSPASVRNQQSSVTQEIRPESNEPASRWTWTVDYYSFRPRTFGITATLHM